MDYLWQIHYDYSWGGFITKALALGLLYLLLHLGRWLLGRLHAPQPWQSQLHRVINHILLVFEPSAILILGSYFVLIKPFYHGLIMLLLMLTNFRHLRNYFSGTIVRFDAAIRLGNRLSSANSKGIITEIGRLGLRLQNNRGIHFIDYDQLWSQGYSLLNSEETGRFFRLQLTPTAAFEASQPKQVLQHLLQVSPYINWQHQLQLKQTDRAEPRFLVDLALHDEKHLNDLIERLEEDHFSCQIAKR